MNSRRRIYLKTSIRAALFDLDGVIFDTEGQYSIFYGNIGREYLPNIPDFAQQIKGRTLTQIFAQWFNGNDKAQADITQRLNCLERQMDYIYIPGVRDFIYMLKKEGIKTAIVTSSNDEKMNSVFRAHPEINELFDLILTAKDYAASKPAPDSYLKGVERFNAKPEECAVFEDSVNGLMAGKNAGCLVVGLTTTNPKEVVAQYADRVIDDFTILSSNRDILFQHG